MSANNIVAPGVENLGIRTFSTDEMAINLIGLLTESMTYTACEHPLWADFGGNFDAVNDLKVNPTPSEPMLCAELLLHVPSVPTMHKIALVVMSILV